MRLICVTWSTTIVSAMVETGASPHWAIARPATTAAVASPTTKPMSVPK